jgi:hypothetical protein
MEGEKDATGPSPRTWNVVFGVIWVLMCLWSFSDGRTWLGIGQLALASMYGLSVMSARIDAFTSASPFGRKRPHDAG